MASSVTRTATWSSSPSGRATPPSRNSWPASPWAGTNRDWISSTSSPSRGASIPVFVGNVENLEKRSARAYRRTLFGSLTNIWLFDRRCVKPDKANASALALLPRDSTHRLDRLWTLVRDTCPLPLLDPWRDSVLELLQAKSMLTRLPFALGPLEGHRLAIDVPTLTEVLGGLIRSGALVGGAPASRTPSAQPLEAVA